MINNISNHFTSANFFDRSPMSFELKKEYNVDLSVCVLKHRFRFCIIISDILNSLNSKSWISKNTLNSDPIAGIVFCNKLDQNTDYYSVFNDNNQLIDIKHIIHLLSKDKFCKSFDNSKISCCSKHLEGDSE